MRISSNAPTMDMVNAWSRSGFGIHRGDPGQIGGGAGALLAGLSSPGASPPAVMSVPLPAASIPTRAADGLGAIQAQVEFGVELGETAYVAMLDQLELVDQMQSLSLTAADWSLDEEERAAVVAEFDSLRERVDQIALETDVDGVTPLDGQDSSAGRDHGPAQVVASALPATTARDLRLDHLSVDTALDGMDTLFALDSVIGQLHGGMDRVAGSVMKLYAVQETLRVAAQPSAESIALAQLDPARAQQDAALGAAATAASGDAGMMRQSQAVTGLLVNVIA